VRGAFEFQGQNVQLLELCSTKFMAAIKEQIITDVKSMKMGSQKILVILLLQLFTKVLLIN
jgi:hypothetical protein